MNSTTVKCAEACRMIHINVILVFAVCQTLSKCHCFEGLMVGLFHRFHTSAVICVDDYVCICALESVKPLIGLVLCSTTALMVYVVQNVCRLLPSPSAGTLLCCVCSRRYTAVMMVMPTKQDLFIVQLYT